MSKRVGPANIQEEVGQTVIGYIRYRDAEIKRLRLSVQKYREEVRECKHCYARLCKDIRIGDRECNLCGDYLSCTTEGCNMGIYSCIQCGSEICGHCSISCPNQHCSELTCLKCCNVELCYHCWVTYQNWSFPCIKHDKRMETFVFQNGTKVRVCSECVIPMKQQEEPFSVDDYTMYTNEIARLRKDFP